MKHVTGVYTAPRPHWVGDGFPVRSMFSYQSHAEQLSPFCCWITRVRIPLHRVMKSAASVSTRTVVLKR